MTDKNGIADFTGLEYKAYRLVEVSAATGYELPENEADRTWNIEATGNDKVIEINVKNTAKHEGRSITVYKTNSDNRPLYFILRSNNLIPSPPAWQRILRQAAMLRGRR